MPIRLCSFDVLEILSAAKDDNAGEVAGVIPKEKSKGISR
jgi:hypothetical protein